jgi:hypothetical protein
MAFGLKTAPATFQKLMNTVLCGLTGSRFFVFLEDIVIYANPLTDHDRKLIDLFKRLRHNLKLQPDKCEFLRKEVTFLGHKISEKGVEPDSRKVEAVENFPTPNTPKQLRNFLELAGYYRRFVPQFSKIANPLHKILKKDAKFVWGEEQEIAFRSLKQKLTSEPILQYPDFSSDFILTTDASNEGASAILSQGPIRKDLPFAYASHSFNRAEKNYSNVEKELAAIVREIKYFRPYLYGKRFKIVSNHKPLTWMSVNDPGSRLLRWRIKLEEYNSEIVYKPRTELECRVSRIGSIGKEEDNPNGVSPSLKLNILQQYHDSVLGGHRGMNKTYEAIKVYYHWPKMKEEVEEYVKWCEMCQLNKMLRPGNKAAMEITSTAKHPFEGWALDIVRPSMETISGNKYRSLFHSAAISQVT